MILFECNQHDAIKYGHKEKKRTGNPKNRSGWY